MQPERPAQHRLTTRNGGRYLSPLEVVRRLKSEFAYVETNPEEGSRHVLEVLQQLLAIKRAGEIPVDEECLSRLERVQQSAICVYFGDDLSSEAALLRTPVVPEEPLFFEYSSSAHQEAAKPLVARCAAALGYEILEEPWP